jgi:glycosyltransferase involved in cell wall biosynthesis
MTNDQLMHVVINGWFAGQSTTGSGQYINHLLTHLPQQAPQVRWSLLLPARSSQTTAYPAPWAGVDLVTRRLLPLPKNLAKLWWEQVTLPLAARHLKADVLWTPYWAAPLWQPLPVAVTVHDLIPALLPAYRGGWQQRLYTALVRHTARRAAAVITVSQASARDIIQHLQIPTERVHVVYHGPNQEGQFQLTAQQLVAVRQKYSLPERFFLYLGGFDVRKNVRATLQAYRRYLDRSGDPAVRLVIAGQLPVADSAFTPDPQKTAAELGLLDQVQFCGWIDDADKPALYALATAFLFPSLYEGFGMMVLEAMSAGTPVITSADFGFRISD